MMTDRDKSVKAADLRRRAEERLKNQPIASPGTLAEVETQSLIHELQIRQIELEMQNEELCASREELDAALARCTDLYDSAPVGYLILAPNGAIGLSNLAAASLLNADRSELLGKRLGLFVAAVDQPQLNAFLDQVFTTQTNLTCELILAPKDQPTQIVQLTCSTIRNSDPPECRATLLDVTERKRVEAALHESENRLTLAVEAAHLGIFEHDHGQDTTYWSPTLRQIFGWKEEPASLPAYLDLIHPQDRAEVAAAVQSAHDPAGTGQYRVEHRIVLHDGTVRWINVLSHTTFAGIASECHPVVTTGTIADVTDFKQAEESLRENQSRMQLLVQVANIGMWDWNLLTNEVYLSPVWKSQLGYADDELPNRYEEWETRLHPDDRDRMLSDVKDRHQTKNQYYEVEFRMRHKDGSWRWILNRDEVKCAADGKPVRMMGCHIDITTRKRNESELQTSRDRLASLTRQLITTQETERRHLAQELHDEIGQVLSAISINLKVVHRNVDPACQSHLEESIHIVDRAIQQVRDLALDLRPAMLDDFGLEAALRWYTTRFAERAALTAHFTACLPQHNLPETVRNTCFRLTQESLTNVLRHAKARQVWIDVQQQEDWLILTIRDDGEGFDVPLALERASRGGSLGLISMQERAEFLGGRLDIESRTGAGTVVRARLPVPEKMRDEG